MRLTLNNAAKTEARPVKQLLALVVFLSGCATATVTVKPMAPVEPTAAAVAAPVCPTGPVTFTQDGAPIGVVVEKVCLVGATPDSYLRLHELVAPREGAALDAAAVRADLAALFEQGMLRDVVVVAQLLPSKGVMLSYVVTEYEWISKVELSGISAVKPDQLDEVAHAGLRANPFLLKAISDRVEAIYAGLGYSKTKAIPTVKSLGGGNAELTLTINEGPRVTVTAIKFEGAKQVPTGELLKALRSAVGSVYLQDLVDLDTQILTSLYFDHGLVNVAVSNTTRPLASPEGAVELVFQMKEGDVYRLGKVSLTGFSIGGDKDVLKNMEARPKSVFSRSAIQRDMERLRARAKLKGLVVEVTPRTSLDPVKKTIDVAFELEKRANPDVRF